MKLAMFDAAAPDYPNPAPAPGVTDRIPANAYWHLVHTLRLSLPPPPGDSEQDLLCRDHAAIARIAALAPASAAEAELAAQFVAASEQWKDCLRLAQLPETSPESAEKCRARALGMMRQANSVLRLLLRLQESRRKLEADAATANRLARTEHCALGLMAEALSAPPQKSAGLIGDRHPGPLPEEEGEGVPVAAPTAAPESEPEERPNPSQPPAGSGASDPGSSPTRETIEPISVLPSDAPSPARGTGRSG